MSEQNELINGICALGLAGVSAFQYSRANEIAARLYDLERDEVKKANEADVWIKAKAAASRLLFAFCAILGAVIGFVSLYRFFS